MSLSPAVPTEAETRRRIKHLIVERLQLEGLHPDSIEDDGPLFGAGLGLDSIDALELVVGLEESFGIKVRDGEVGRETLASVTVLARFVRRRLTAGDGAEH